MKLSYEDKVQIYDLRKSGATLKSLSKQFNLNQSGIEYLIRLIDRHGVDIVKRGKK
ncbi:IS3 family transposase, partial [Neisseria mucosa]|nr:IS3 family transposase [Neisseria mucosa]